MIRLVLVGLLLAVTVVGLVAGLVWVLWQFVGRPAAVSCGLLRPRAYDLVVRGWKAERRGRWADALAAYDEAIRAEPGSEYAGYAHARREALLQSFPDLAGAGPPTPPAQE
jgi:hypothetical protein